ncbi:hypothetical protein NUSPORA_01894 [Nucleospora cyclopteri]
MPENDDLCKLQNLDNQALMKVLNERYGSTEIYTNCGLLLLSINPYTELDLYSKSIKEMYKLGHNLKPHIFHVVEECLHNIKIYGDHSILISGESGAGKTECARNILQYLDISHIKDIDNIIESVGNAKTIHNKNSSRFGKLIRIDGHMKIETFLLEKSRVTSQTKGEQNFHLFYYILANNKRTMKNDFIEFYSENTVEQKELCEKYKQLKKSFQVLNINFTVIEKLMIGILQIGSIKIENNKICNLNVIENICETFGINQLDLKDYLLIKKLMIKEEQIIKPLTTDESLVLRNSLARLIYVQVFNYIIKSINNYLINIETEIYGLNILDIFGFENFNDNGLDQFCINWCNEKIYDEFVKRTFEHQKMIFLKEEIELSSIKDKTVTNTSSIKALRMTKSTIDLLEKKCGLVDLVMEESNINGNPDNLAIKIKQFLNLTVKYKTTVEFRHFAGDIDYNLTDFVIKNKEKGNIDIVKGYKDIFSATNESTTNVVGYFKKSLNNLFTILNSTTIKYIKCIKPNNTKTPMYFDPAIVFKQLRANGILQTIQLSKHLYPCSMFVDEFQERYKNIDIKYDEIIKGKTRYFFKNETLYKLERNLEMNEIYKKNKILRNKEIIRLTIKKIIIAIKKEEEEIKKKEEELKIEKNEEELKIKNDEFNKKVIKHCLEQNNSSESDEEYSGAINIEINDKEEKSIIDYYSLGNGISEYIKTLEQELANYKKFSVECSKCKILEQKYKIQSEKLMKKQNIELELERLKLKLSNYEQRDVSSDSIERISVYNIFGCMIQLYIDHCPFYSNKDIPKDEMMSFAHAIKYVINSMGEIAANENISVALEELSKRIKLIDEDVERSLFFLGNVIELFAVLNNSSLIKLTDENNDNFLGIMQLFFDIICRLFKNKIREFLPFAVIEHQEIKNLKVKQSIFKKIFVGPSIKSLKQSLENIFDMCSYYCLPYDLINNIMAFLISYIDYESFNCLLVKRNYLSFNRCAQISYNLSEITQLNCQIGFADINKCLGHITEAIKIATILATERFEPEILENTFLNSLQINCLIDLFNTPPIDKIDCRGIYNKFIKEPTPEFPIINYQSTIKNFVKPLFIPRKAIKSILKIIEEQERGY